MPALSTLAIVGAIGGGIGVLAKQQKKAAQKQQKKFEQSLPEPDAPIAQGQPGEGAASIQKRSIKAGRGGTILTGQLAPTKIGKKRLLG